MGPHILRHAFASYLVRLGEVKTASLYLHHKDTSTTEHLYSAFTERHTSVISAMRAAARKAAKTDGSMPAPTAARATRDDDMAAIAALTSALLAGKLPKAQFTAAVASLSAA